MIAEEEKRGSKEGSLIEGKAEEVEDVEAQGKREGEGKAEVSHSTRGYCGTRFRNVGSRTLSLSYYIDGRPHARLDPSKF